MVVAAQVTHGSRSAHGQVKGSRSSHGFCLKEGVYSRKLGLGVLKEGDTPEDGAKSGSSRRQVGTLEVGRCLEEGAKRGKYSLLGPSFLSYTGRPAVPKKGGGGLSFLSLY